jgi:DNA (cytosine-5)-methyltransferase 1
LGYRLKIKVLQSQHYGVPQKRKRTIIVGCKEDYQFELPRPKFDCVENNEYIRAINLEDVLDDIYVENKIAINHDEQKATPLSKITIERIKHIPEGRGIRYKKDEDEFFPEHLKLDVDWNTIREGRLRELRYHRLSKKDPSPTINTSNEQYFHPDKDRRFTVRELARIQTFPNDFEFFGSIKNQKKLVGNAVPVMMAKAIGESIVKSFEEKIVCSKEDSAIDLSKEIGKGFHYDKYLEQ